MENITPVSVINLMPETNEQIKNFAQQVKEQLLNGEYDYRKFLYQKRFIEKTLEAISEDKEVKDYLEKEIEKYGKEGSGFNDVRFELSERKTWDYSKTGDSTLSDLENKKKLIDEQIKARQKLLQTAKKEFADVETGEIIFPASYSSKSYIRTTQIKK